MLKKTIELGGFTLAEVLITLGIIGVVAAMTMPTLINSTQGAQYKTAYKKSLTVLSQAVTMNIALNDYDLSQIVAGTNEKPNTNTGGDPSNATTLGGAQSLYDLFSKRLNIVRTASGMDFTGGPGMESQSNFYKVVSDGNDSERGDFVSKHGTNNGSWFMSGMGGTSWAPETTLLFMNDGITFIFDNRQSNCAKANPNIGIAADNYCYGFIDVNGQKAPNRVVQCDAGQEPDGSDDFTCTVSNPTDIYPIALYDQSVIPASAAARAVLYNK